MNHIDRSDSKQSFEKLRSQAELGNEDDASRLLPAQSRRARRVSLWLGVIWIVAFNLYFYSLTLPNNNLSRLQVWRELPYYLMLLPAAGGPPSGLSYLPQRVDLVIVSAFIVAGAWGIGRLLLRLIRVPLSPLPSEQHVFAFGCGLSALSLVTLGCGLLGLLRRELLGGIIAAAVVVELAMRVAGRSRKQDLGQDVEQSTQTASTSTAGASSFKWMCLIAIVPFALAMALGAMLPSTDFDVKEYHLEGPKEFFLAGRVEMLPHNVYTSFPFLTEMLSLLPMVLCDSWFRGALVGQTVLMCFAPLTAWLLYAAGRRWFSPAAGWLAALFYLSTPWTFRISTIAYAEGGLSFFLAAALFATMIAIERLARRENAGRYVLLAGFLAGSAMACKYPGVLSVVVPMGGALVAACLFVQNPFSSRFRTALRSGLLFSAGVLVAVGPWLAKNAIETGNPVYPLLYSIFDGKDWDADVDARWKDAHSPDDHDLARLPYWVRDVTAKNDWLSPLLYAFAPLALFAARGRRIVLAMWLFAGYLFVTWWAFTHRLDRFWVPMLPVAALLAGIGAASLTSRAGKVAAAVCIAAGLLFNLAMMVSGLSGYNHFLADLNAARDWTARTTSPEIFYLNENLPTRAKVLCVGEAEVFDAKFPVVYNTVFDRSIFEEWTADEQPGVPAGELPMRDPAAIRKRLQEEGVTHILVNWQEILRYRTTYGYTDYVSPEKFDRLQQAGVLAPPLTFGSLIKPGVSADLLAEAQTNWQPGFLRTVDGKLVYVGTVRVDLPQREADEVSRWAPSLFARIPASPSRVLVDFQIYPVVP